MALSDNLLKQFASTVAVKKSNRGDSTIKYGVAVESEGELYVRLDGSDILTPVSMAMDAIDGDRVSVTIQNHTAVITGNLTAPASARTATGILSISNSEIEDMLTL